MEEQNEVKFLCEKAQKDFKEKNFESVLESLSSLNKQQSRIHSQKWELNRILTHFAKSAFTNADQYRSSFLKLVPEAKNGQWEELVSTNMDQSALLYNLAVINYHGEQYKTCLNLLQKLDRVRFPEKLRLEGMLLEIEVYLLLQQGEKARIACEKARKFLEESGLRGSAEGVEILERLHLCRLRSDLTLKQLENFALLQQYTLQREFGSRENNWKLSALNAHFNCLLTVKERDCPNIVSQLGSIYPKDERCRSVLANNNQGCVYGKFSKSHLALLYFNRTLSEIRALEAGGERSLFKCPALWKLAVLYNTGVALLKTGKAQSAFDSLLQVVQYYPDNPRLWLRLAECCVAAHGMQSKKQEIVREVIGIGPHRKAVLNSQLGNSAVVESQGGMGAIPMPSLDFAALCVRNALTLLPDTSVEELEKGGKSLPAPPGPPLSALQIHQLRCSILCCAAYVSLCLGETQMALEYSLRLSRLPFLSYTHQCLWRLYKAEAYVLLEDFSAAVQLLDPTKVMQPQDSFAHPHHLFGFPDLKSLMIYNLSLSCAMEENYPEAENVITIITKGNAGGVLPPEVTMLALFLKIKNGQLDEARQTVIGQLPYLRL